MWTLAAKCSSNQSASLKLSLPFPHHFARLGSTLGFCCFFFRVRRHKPILGHQLWMSVLFPHCKVQSTQGDLAWHFPKPESNMHQQNVSVHSLFHTGPKSILSMHWHPRKTQTCILTTPLPDLDSAQSTCHLFIIYNVPLVFSSYVTLTLVVRAFQNK